MVKRIFWRKKPRSAVCSYVIIYVNRNTCSRIMSFLYGVIIKIKGMIFMKKATTTIAKILNKYCIDCKKVNVDFIVQKVKERLLI